MSEYRNDPPIDFMLDKDSKDSEDYANRYDQHIHAMTAERLNSKSDIAWELTIRDQRIAELEEQNKRLVEILGRATNAGTYAMPPDGEYTTMFRLYVNQDDREFIEGIVSIGPKQLTGYESEALDKALRASSTLVGRGMEKDDE